MAIWQQAVCRRMARLAHAHAVHRTTAPASQTPTAGLPLHQTGPAESVACSDFGAWSRKGGSTHPSPPGTSASA